LLCDLMASHPFAQKAREEWGTLRAGSASEVKGWATVIIRGLNGAADAAAYPKLESWRGLKVKSPALSQKARQGRATL
jgi:hypothetical protein